MMALDDSMTVEDAERELAKIEGLPQAFKDEILAQVALSNDLRQHLQSKAEDIKNGKDGGNWDTLYAELNEIAEKHGHLGGLPMPSLPDEETKHGGHRLVLADGAPLAWTNLSLPTESAIRLAQLGQHVRNSWEQLGDMTVTVVDTEDGPMVLRETHAGGRLRKLLADLSVRHDQVALTADAELKALELLKTKVGENQFRTYVLSGIFVETSKRSGLFYFFRKGRPTIVASPHSASGEDGDVRMIAALCFHPMGYYEGCHVGVMSPTDEVIAALLTMRADEHFLWRKSGQWSASDPRSGI